MWGLAAAAAATLAAGIAGAFALGGER